MILPPRDLQLCQQVLDDITSERLRYALPLCRDKLACVVFELHRKGFRRYDQLRRLADRMPVTQVRSSTRLLPGRREGIQLEVDHSAEARPAAPPPRAPLNTYKI